MPVRFLEKNEYSKSIPLFVSCFGDDEEFMAEYYGEISADGSCSGLVQNNRIAVLEQDGEILSMVQIQQETIETADGHKLSAPYIMGVSTAPDCRHRGYMDQVMNYVIDQLRAEKHPICFLIAVDRDIYRHLGFAHDWKLTEAECDKLYADDGLDTASALYLSEEVFYGTETFKILL